MNKYYIDKKVNRIIKECNCNNLYELCDYKKILLLEYDLGSSYGFYFYLEKTKLILLNAKLSDDHKKIVFSHELGHSELHTKINCAFTKKYTYMKQSTYENEANYYSYKILKKLNLVSDICIHSEEISELDNGFLSLIQGVASL